MKTEIITAKRIIFTFTDKINILLLGVDRLTGSQRSDTIIVASIGYSSLSLTSIMRDTIVNIPGHGSTKVNAAYAYGGPEPRDTLGM